MNTYSCTAKSPSGSLGLSGSLALLMQILEPPHFALLDELVYERLLLPRLVHDVHAKVVVDALVQGFCLVVVMDFTLEKIEAVDIDRLGLVGLVPVEVIDGQTPARGMPSSVRDPNFGLQVMDIFMGDPADVKASHQVHRLLDFEIHCRSEEAIRASHHESVREERENYGSTWNVIFGIRGLQHAVSEVDSRLVPCIFIEARHFRLEVVEPDHLVHFINQIPKRFAFDQGGPVAEDAYPLAVELWLAGNDPAPPALVREHPLHKMASENAPEAWVVDTPEPKDVRDDSAEEGPVRQRAPHKCRVVKARAR